MMGGNRIPNYYLGLLVN